MKLIVLILLVFTQLKANAGLNIASYNIRNFDYDQRSNTPTNKHHLAKTLGKIDFDLLAVQEINKKDVFANMIDRQFYGRYETYLSECGGSHDQHLGFVVDKSKFTVIDFSEDLRTVNVGNPRQANCRNGSRPLAIIKLRYKKTRIALAAISVHLKSGGRENHIRKRFKQIKQIMKVRQELQREGFENVVIMGDFNTTEYIKSQRTQRQNFSQELANSSLINRTAALSCTSYWWGERHDDHFYPSHLDHIITSSNLRSKTAPKVYGHCAALACGSAHLRDMTVSFDEVSDHCPIGVSLDL